MIQNFRYLDEWSKEKLEEEAKTDFCYRSKRLKVSRIPQGIALPYKEIEKWGGGRTPELLGGIVDGGESRFVPLSAQTLANYYMERAYTVEHEVPFIKEDVIYLGIYHMHWGHFLCECLNRIWFALQQDLSDVQLIYIVHENDDSAALSGPMLELIEMLGFKKNQILLINRPTRFKSIIVPELSCVNGPLSKNRYYTKEFKNVFDKVRDCVAPKGQDKIYLTRKRLPKQNEIGELAIERFFEANGYLVISPECYSLREQIAYIKGAKIIAALQGTLPHNILFGNDGLHITVINKLYRVNPFQGVINDIRDAHVTYVDAFFTFFPISNGKGPFMIAFNENMTRFARENHMKIPEDIKDLDAYDYAWYFIKYITLNREMEIINKDELERLAKIYAFYANRVPDSIFRGLNSIAARMRCLDEDYGRREFLCNPTGQIRRVLEASRRGKLVIFGAGNLSKKLVVEYGLAVRYFIDNDSSRVGMKWFDKPIIPISEVVDRKDTIYIIASRDYLNMKGQLMEAGILEECIIDGYLLIEV